MLSSVDSKRCDLILPALSPGGIAGIVIVVIVFALLGFSLLVISIICVTRIFRNSKAVNIKNDIFDSPEELEMFTLGKETLQPPKMAPNNARLIVAPKDELEFGNELGAGAFGTVYEGYWQPDHNKYHVAIKVLKNAAPSANTELLQEGAVMASLDHDNVVRLYCVCMSKQLMLVSQFVPLGSLLDYLKKHKEKLNGYTILLFSSQIAKGMAYLESKHLVHRDLAARNVLIQTPVKVKITDFGLTRIVESDQAHYEASSSKMPVRWLPPESIRQRVFNHKTDVWSYGVTIWEILTFGARPYKV
jgi:L1 cell adhesion molecule